MVATSIFNTKIQHLGIWEVISFDGLSGGCVFPGNHLSHFTESRLWTIFIPDQSKYESQIVLISADLQKWLKLMLLIMTNCWRESCPLPLIVQSCLRSIIASTMARFAPVFLQNQMDIFMLVTLSR